MTELSVELNHTFFVLAREGPMEYRDAHPKRDTLELIQRVGTEKHLKKKIRRIAERFPHEWPLHEQAAYILRAYSGLQLFPDANHRTGLALMRVHLHHQGYEFTLSGQALQLFIDKIRNPRSRHNTRCNAGQLLDRNQSLFYISDIIKSHMKKLSLSQRILAKARILRRRKVPPTLLFTSYEDPEAERKRKAGGDSS